MYVALRKQVIYEENTCCEEKNHDNYGGIPGGVTGSKLLFHWKGREDADIVFTVIVDIEAVVLEESLSLLPITR